MEHSVPVEIIQRVFETAVRWDPKHSTHLALVCKSLREWITPLLYRDVTLCNKIAFDKFMQTFKNNSSLGLLTRSLWVGSLSTGNQKPAASTWGIAALFERDLTHILSHTPDLKRLALINMPHWSTAGWSVLEESLPAGLESLAAGPYHGVLTSRVNFRR